MTGLELIQAMTEGKVLVKVHHNDEYCSEYLYSYEFEGKRYLDMRGWGTGFGKANERLEEVLLRPEGWKVVDGFHMDQGYPYPWSTVHSEHAKA